jgi:cytochrome c-type biogenesis protein CcmH
MRTLLCVVLLCVTAVLHAREAPPLADDPALEQRVMRLSSELRCLVCQNETLADSRADLAVDLRNQVREQMRAGKSDEQIKAWLTDRYGDFVLYRPPVKPTTWLLWFGPFVLLIAAAATLLVYLRRRQARTAAAQLTPEQHHQAQALLAEELRDETP